MIYAKIDQRFEVGEIKKSFWDFLDSPFSLQMKNIVCYYEITYLDGYKKVAERFDTLEECIQILMKGDFIPISEFIFFKNSKLK